MAKKKTTQKKGTTTPRGLGYATRAASKTVRPVLKRAAERVGEAAYKPFEVAGEFAGGLRGAPAPTAVPAPRPLSRRIVPASVPTSSSTANAAPAPPVSLSHAATPMPSQGGAVSLMRNLGTPAVPTPLPQIGAPAPQSVKPVLPPSITGSAPNPVPATGVRTEIAVPGQPPTTEPPVPRVPVTTGEEADRARVFGAEPTFAGAISPEARAALRRIRGIREPLDPNAYVFPRMTPEAAAAGLGESVSTDRAAALQQNQRSIARQHASALSGVGSDEGLPKLAGQRADESHADLARRRQAIASQNMMRGQDRMATLDAAKHSRILGMSPHTDALGNTYTGGERIAAGGGESDFRQRLELSRQKRELARQQQVQRDHQTQLAQIQADADLGSAQAVQLGKQQQALQKLQADAQAAEADRQIRMIGTFMKEGNMDLESAVAAMRNLEGVELGQDISPAGEPNEAAIQYLRDNASDQSIVAQFEEKYGLGSAQKYLNAG